MDVFLICFFVLITGACIGSFLNVVALRALTKESIVLPPSKCPKCGEHIKWYDNIPVLSYFLTFKGKCRNCGEKVSIQYPIVEALTAVIFLTTFLIFGPTIKTLLLLILFSISIVIIITDIKENAVFEVHSWILIITSILTALYINGVNNYSSVAIGIIAAVFIMEFLARSLYYMIRKEETEEEEVNTFKIDKYFYPLIIFFTVLAVLISPLETGIGIKTLLPCILTVSALFFSIKSVKKEFSISFFGIALFLSVIVTTLTVHYIRSSIMTILALIAGIVLIKLAAVMYNIATEKLGTIVNDTQEEPIEDTTDKEINEYVKENKRAFGEGDTYIAAASGAILGLNFIIALVLAAVLNLIPIISQFVKDIINQKRHIMIFSIFGLLLICFLLYCFNIFDEYTTFSMLIIAIVFAVDFIIGMKKMNTKVGFKSMPFGPSLIIATFIVFFFIMKLINLNAIF